MPSRNTGSKGILKRANTFHPLEEIAFDIGKALLRHIHVAGPMKIFYFAKCNELKTDIYKISSNFDATLASQINLKLSSILYQETKFPTTYHALHLILQANLFAAIDRWFSST